MSTALIVGDMQNAFMDVHSAERGPGAGGFSELAGRLRESDVDAVTVVGVAADVCVA